MTDQPGPPTLSARGLGLATLIALVVAGLALTVYVLPANYGLDPLGAGQALGIEGQPPSEDTAGDEPGSGATDTLDNRTLNVESTELSRYRTSWPTTEQAGPSTDGYTAEEETTTVELDVAQANVSQLTVTLTWTDDNATAGQESKPDELELVLESPDGETTEPVSAENPQGGEGRLTANLSIVELPAPSPVDARERAQARSQALRQAPAEAPEGVWKVHVTVVEAGDANATGSLLPGSGTPGEDEGTNWTLTSTATSYELSLEKRGPSPIRQETRTFQVAAGSGFEHKVSLPEGADLTYEWTATGEAFYDFHGEPEGNAADFESYETGTRTAASGTFTAPFEGTHGWYWENRADDPLEITLTTRGAYDDGFTT